MMIPIVAAGLGRLACELTAALGGGAWEGR
jgi:hypothetical protein